MKKIIMTLMLIIGITFVFTATNNVFALSASEMKGQADNWLEQGGANATITTGKAWLKLKPIGQILVAVASVVLVISFMYLGIKYMIADPSGKADVKQRLIWLVIATVVVYGGVGIFTIIVRVMNSVLA